MEYQLKTVYGASFHKKVPDRFCFLSMLFLAFSPLDFHSARFLANVGITVLRHTFTPFPLLPIEVAFRGSNSFIVRNSIRLLLWSGVFDAPYKHVCIRLLVQWCYCCSWSFSRMHYTQKKVQKFFAQLGNANEFLNHSIFAKCPHQIAFKCVVRQMALQVLVG